MNKYKIELNSLLEITQAINANIPEDHLYKVFYFTCISNLHISELALFVLEKDSFVEKFSHALSFTTKDLELFQSVDFEVSKVKSIYPNINQVFPVRHKKKLLAALVLGKHNSDDLEQSYSFLQTISNIVLVAIENKRLARITLVQERYKRDLEIARSVQEMLIPSKLPNNEYLKAAATYLPHQSIGGDYYDVIKVEENYVFCMADVSGKGVSAALIMSNFQASLRSLCKVTHNVEEIAIDLNKHLLENAISDHFVTCFLAHYHVKTRVLTYLNAGHCPPYLVNSQKYETLTKGAYMLGVFDDFPSNIKGEVVISPGDKLFMYTDGVSETTDDLGNEFGEERIIEFLRNTLEEELTMNLADLIICVDEFKESQDYKDDLTMLSVVFF